MSPSPYFTLPFLLLVAIFQATAAPRLAVGGARPDVMLLSVISWSLLTALRTRELEYAGEPPSLTRGINDGVIWAFTGGVFLDLLSLAPLGAHAFALMIAALVVGVIGARVAGLTLIMAPLLTALATPVYHLVFLTELAVTGRPVPVEAYLHQVIAPSVAFNLALVPVIYLLLYLVNRQTAQARLEW